MTEFGRKRTCLKRIRGYDTEGKKEVEVGILLICNDNNVIANKSFFNKLF